MDCEVEDIRSRDRARKTWSKVVEKLGTLPLDQSGGLSHCALSFLYILSFSYYPQQCTQRRSLSRCLSAVAAAKPACIDPAAWLIACVDHAQLVTHGICIPAEAASAAVTDTFQNSSRMFIVVGCHTPQLHKEDAVERIKWRQLIKRY